MINNLVGQKFGRLKVISRAEDNVSKSGYRTVMWNCICDCGNQVTVRGKSLKNGDSKSCGCLQKELISQRASKHHGVGTRLYAIWDSMRQRCNNPKNQAYRNYGGRGIQICKDWNNFNKFKNWAYDNGYSDTAKRGEITLDRINVNENYSPENCRWINMKRQANNKRNTVYLTYKDKTLSLSEWSDITKIKYCTLWRRYKQGKTPEQILDTSNIKNFK